MDVYNPNKQLKLHNKLPPSKNTQETSYFANSQTGVLEDSYKSTKSTNLIINLNQPKKGGSTKSRTLTNPIKKP